MNNRIHKNDLTLIGRIADQAHEETVVQYNMRMKTEHPSDVIFYDMFNDKFAELIIQECLNVISQQERVPPSFFFSKPSHQHILAIKDHFGVKE